MTDVFLGPHSGPEELGEEEEGALMMRLLRLAAAAEQGSEHPLAQALLHAAAAHRLTLPRLPASQLGSEEGKGVTADIPSEGGRILVGNRLLLEGYGLAVPAFLEAKMRAAEAKGKTALCVAVAGSSKAVAGSDAHAVAGSVLGVLCVSDLPKVPVTHIHSHTHTDIHI